MKELIRILDKNIEKSACLRRLKPFFEEGFKNPKNFKKEMIQDTRGIVENGFMILQKHFFTLYFIQKKFTILKLPLFYP